MSLEALRTGDAPAAIGPYSQAIAHNGLVYCSGQIALTPTGGDDALRADVATQTRQVLTNLSGVLTTASAGLGDVIQTTVFLVDMTDFAAMNQVYAEMFGDHKPARATVAVAGLPRGARVEISATALDRRPLPLDASQLSAGAALAR